MNTRLYVGNLSFQTDENTLRTAFEPYGEVVEAKIITDRDTGRPRGFGFVTMATAEGSRQAIEGMSGANLDGRPLRVNEAEDRRGGGGYRGGQGGGGRGGRDRW